MTDHPAIEVRTNRSEMLNHLNSALESLELEIHEQSSTVFTYFDMYKLQEPPKVADHYQRIISLLPNKSTDSIDDKKLLAERLENHNCSIMPKTYFNLSEVPREDPDKIWFIKWPYGTGGKDMQAARTSDLDGLKLFKQHIIQEGVTDILTFQDKKFTIRSYVLIWNGTINLHPQAFMVVHGPKYNPKSTDYSVQIKHAGYHKADSPINLIPLVNNPNYKELFASMMESTRHLLDPFSDITAQTSEDIYTLLGVDFIPTYNKQVKLIEINHRPNLIHTEEINKTINIPMIADVLIKTLKLHRNSKFVRVYTDDY